MDSYSWHSSAANFGSDYAGGFDPLSENFGGLCPNWRVESVPPSQALVLDSERGELVKATVRIGKKSGVSEEKVMAALKSHSEAERRRRERINAHLTTLRGLVPCTEKNFCREHSKLIDCFGIWWRMSLKQMDKATLLAEVINQVKQLKETATESSAGLVIPMDTDEVKVEPLNGADGTFSIQASLCWDYRPELLSQLRQALNSLHLDILKAEISTLGSRVKNVFVLTSQDNQQVENAEACQLLVNSVHHALSSILDKVSASAEYSPRTTLSNKRRRIAFFESSSSSS